MLSQGWRGAQDDIQFKTIGFRANLMRSVQMKILVLALASVLLPGQSASFQTQTNTPRSTPEIVCPNVTPVDGNSEFYRSLTRRELRELGRAGDPVGLYYLSHADLRNEREIAAKDKLVRAAEAGLRDAYLRLADLAKTDLEKNAALICAERLAQKDHQN